DRIDFSKLEMDLTEYVSGKFKGTRKDVVARTRMRTRKKGKKGKRTFIDVDIYFLFEHKSGWVSAEELFLTLLAYKQVMWEKDMAAKRPLRVILPIVFYHGETKWNTSRSFVDCFNVENEIKEYLINFDYLLFDTQDWDFQQEKNREMGKSVFLISAIALMKSAFSNDLESMKGIFDFWYEKGFIEEKEKILICLTYIAQTRNLNPV
ncbi:MAG: Rpn family recombination-promoting nuclease/putative transposase, partial [bacterium]|nr:Rpn family recombination-promoting nuclease/putative transposase [bacterium]